MKRNWFSHKIDNKQKYTLSLNQIKHIRIIFELKIIQTQINSKDVFLTYLLKNVVPSKGKNMQSIKNIESKIK